MVKRLIFWFPSDETPQHLHHPVADVSPCPRPALLALPSSSGIAACGESPQAPSAPRSAAAPCIVPWCLSDSQAAGQKLRFIHHDSNDLMFYLSLMVCGSCAVV